MVGTPPIEVAPSFSMSRSASTASHLRRITSLPPMQIETFNAEKQPVTWNIGIASR